MFSKGWVGLPRVYPGSCYLTALPGTRVRRCLVAELTVIKRVGAGLGPAFALASTITTPSVATSPFPSWAALFTNCHKNPS